VKVPTELQTPDGIIYRSAPSWFHLQNGRLAIVGCQRSNCKLPDMEI